MEVNERFVAKEIFLKEVNIGLLKIEISVILNISYTVYFTANDGYNRRIWKTQLTDADGKVKVYNSVSEAISDAQKVIETALRKQSLPLPI